MREGQYDSCKNRYHSCVLGCRTYRNRKCIKAVLPEVYVVRFEGVHEHFGKTDGFCGGFDKTGTVEEHYQCDEGHYNSEYSFPVIPIVPLLLVMAVKR